MKKLSLILVFLAFILITPSAVRADDEVRSLQIDLRTKGFTQANYLDNLDSSNIIFAPNDRFQLQLVISNNGNRNQTNIQVNQTLPANVNIDAPVTFTIPQIAPYQQYIKNIVVTVKDKTSVLNALTKNYYSTNIKSDVGTQDSDTASFYTSGGTKGVKTAATVATPASSTVLPNTGSTSLIFLGSALALILGFAGFKLRTLARGY